MLSLPVHQQTTFVLVQPHYPENVGAAARALKTMGFRRLVLVRPGRMAVPQHLMARKMAVKSLDVLDATITHKTLDAALEGIDVVFATSSRSGVSYIESPVEAAQDILQLVDRKQQVALVFGNEKSGLDREQLKRCSRFIRIAMAAEQPSINLAQAVQILAYQLLATALATPSG
jgi:TrmH family RNA methyltransferase